MRGSGATELAARARPHQNLYAPRSATSQSTPRTPTYQLLGLGKGDAGAQCSVKGLPSPDGLGSFRGARRSTRARDQAWGPTKRRRTAGANNKARSEVRYRTIRSSRGNLAAHRSALTSRAGKPRSKEQLLVGAASDGETAIAKTR